MATIGLARIEGPVVVDLLLNHEAMVEYLGLTLETVSRQMTTLKGDNIIVLDGKRRVKVPDIRRLLQETGDNADGGMVA